MTGVFQKEAIAFFTRIDTSDLINEYQDLELFDLIDTLVSLTESDTSYISLLFDLDRTVTHNAELGEYISENIHKAALLNTEEFVRVLKNVAPKEKETIKGTLFWLVENDKLDEFAGNLKKISDESLFEEILEIRKYLGID